MKRWTPTQKRIIHRLRTLHAVEKEPLNLTYVKARHPKLLRQVMSLKHFRGWRNALEAAGLSYDVIRIELSERIRCAVCGRELKSLSAHLAVIHELTVEEYEELYPGEPTKSDLVRASATWSLRQPPHWEPVWSREYVVDYLIFKDEQGEDLAPWTVYRDDPCLHANAKAYFGSYRAAVEAAGIDYREVRRIELTEQWTPEKVLERLRRLHIEEPLESTSDIRRRDSRLYDRCVHYYGGQVAALEAAGIPYLRLRRRRKLGCSRQDVLRTIRVLADAGLSIRPDALPAHLDDQAEQLLATAEEKFGSYEQAVARAGIDYANHRGRRRLTLSPNGRHETNGQGKA